MEPQVIQELVACFVPERMQHVPGIVPRRAVQLGMYMVTAWFLNDRQAIEPQRFDGQETDHPTEDDTFTRDVDKNDFDINKWLVKYPLPRSTSALSPAFAPDWLLSECLAGDFDDEVHFSFTQTPLRTYPPTLVLVTAFNRLEEQFEHVAAVTTIGICGDIGLASLASTSLATRVAAHCTLPMVFELYEALSFAFGDTSAVLTAAAEHGRETTVRYLCSIQGTWLSAAATERASVNGHLPVVRFLYELTHELPQKLKIDPCDADTGTAHEVVLLGATRALPQVLAKGNDPMAAYLVSIGATVSTLDLLRAAEQGCICTIEVMLRRDTQALLDVSAAMRVAAASVQHSSFKRLNDAWRTRHPESDTASIPQMEPIAEPETRDASEDDALVWKQGANSSSQATERSAPVMEVFTSRELVRHISHFRPLSARIWYERVMQELPDAIRDFVQGTQIPGLLPRLAILRNELEVLVPLHSMSQNPAYRGRRDLEFKSAMYDAAVEGRVEALQRLHALPGMTCRSDTMAVAVRSGWADVVDWLAKHRPESAWGLAAADVAFAERCGFHDVVRLVRDVHEVPCLVEPLRS
ncbi:hypothetical protein P43SY_004965 [Pythium insidiosum]|uniref:Ankyrin repeat protein n=1 Tax=Pythium insidiosum TaxID=114742 RepID=A0AAD5Q9J1_PYTIN|nr:hypothetical protein P43SY_004965 [Pythium insidiosum]